MKWVFCCWMLLASATVAWSQAEPCLAGTQDPACGITVTMNPPVNAEDHIFNVPNQITIDVPLRLHPTKVQLTAGPTGTEVADAFKPIAETSHYKKANGLARFQIPVNSCPGNHNAFNFNIYTQRFPYPMTVNVQPLECK